MIDLPASPTLLSAADSALLVVDLQERLMPAIDGGAAVLARAGLLLRAARRLGVPARASEQYPKGLGPTVPEIAELLDLGAVATKLTFSALREPACAEMIEQLAGDTVVVAGAETHVCVLQTVMDLLAQGRAVHVVEDAVGSRRASDKAAGLARMARAGAVIVTAEMVVFEWLERAGTPEFKELVGLLK